jgi:hypothetical protein
VLPIGTIYPYFWAEIITVRNERDVRGTLMVSNAIRTTCFCLQNSLLNASAITRLRVTASAKFPEYVADNRTRRQPDRFTRSTNETIDALADSEMRDSASGNGILAEACVTQLFTSLFCVVVVGKVVVVVVVVDVSAG